MVGATILIALIILGWMMLRFGGGVMTPFTTKRIPVVFHSERADGLGEGSPVLYRGVNVGQITSVKRTENDRDILISGMVETTPPLPANVHAIIRPAGLIGGGSQVLLILNDPQPAREPLARDQQIQATYATLTSEYLPPEFSDLARELKDTVRQFREARVVDKFNEQLDRAGRLMDAFQKVVDDPDTQRNLKDAIANLRTATEQANKIAGNLDKFTTDLNKLQADTSATINQARSTIVKTEGHIDDLSKQIGDRMQQLATLLDRFNSIATKIDQGEGTAGQLINDPRLYESLVDTSRELNATITDMKRLVEQWEQEGLSLKLK